MPNLTPLLPAILPAPEVRPLPSGAAGPPLKGIARLAASAARADAKRAVEYFELPVRSILNRCLSDRVPFAWTINPYRGCEFGCKYCYARYTHEYMELEGGDFERKIFAKQQARALLTRELETEKIYGEHIAMGTATDPYQPAEREFGVTRAVLETLAEKSGLDLSITTKSNLVLRDSDVLRRIHTHSRLHINLTITTLNARLARALEPRAPTPELRLKVVEQLRAQGLAVGVFVMPVLPGINDGAADLEALVRAAKEHGAQYLAASVLFLMPSAQKQFFPFLEQKSPRLVRHYRQLYARSAYAPNDYKQAISGLMVKLRARYGLAASPEPYSREGIQPLAPQLHLFEAQSSAQAAASQVTVRKESADGLRACSCALPG